MWAHPIGAFAFFATLGGLFGYTEAGTWGMVVGIPLMGLGFPALFVGWLWVCAWLVDQPDGLVEPYRRIAAKLKGDGWHS